MSIELVPKTRSKKVKSIWVGGMIWGIYLEETGMGYVLGYGAGRTPGSYVYKSGNNGSPVSNDGYEVTEEEALMMARVGRGFLSVQRFVQKEWDSLTPEQYKEQWDYKTRPEGKLLYNQPWHEERLKQIEAIVDFMEKSKGFKIT